ncbi:MAG: DegV family protein [Dehalobacterium sp.]
MKEKIAQIVDSAGNMPREVLKKYHIREVPFYYTFDGDNYFQENTKHDGMAFYRHMKEHSDQVPRTSAPNVDDWTQAFEEAYKNGCHKIIVTTISQALSSSFNNANLARKMYLSKVKDIEIDIITSNSCACGQAALEIKIAQMIHDARLNWDDICTRAKGMIPSLTTFFTVQNLFYMKVGGRIGGATAFMGHIMNIKPICEFADGVVRPVKSVRGRKKSLTTMVDYFISRIKRVSNPVICTQNALCEDEELFMVDYLCSGLGYHGPVYRGMLGVIVGAHSGPGSIGLGFVGES